MFKFQEGYMYNMPAHFTGRKGTPSAQTYHDVCSIAISYETERAALEKYVPEAFHLTEPLIMLNYSVCRACDWLSGGSYSLVSVNAPVTYQEGSEHLEGPFALVLWENMTEPILFGRNNGMPKIFANIEDPHQVGDRVFTNLSHGGTPFLRIDFSKKERMSAEDLAPQSMNWFGWLYVPNIGRAGAALSHATLYPQEFAWRDGWKGVGSVVWETGTPEQHPMQFPIIKALSELPIKGYGECSMKFGSNTLRGDLARALGIRGELARAA